MRITGDALREIGISPNEADTNFEPANIVDGLFAIARAIHKLSAAIDAHKPVERTEPDFPENYST